MHFHVVVVQWRQRNVQKSVMHVQSCCLANLNPLFCAVLVDVAVVVACPYSLIEKPWGEVAQTREPFEFGPL